MADLYLEPIPEKFLFLKNADKNPSHEVDGWKKRV